MSKKLSVINMVWIGDRISNTEKMCMLSFLYNGHDVHVWCYGKIDNLPNGVVLRDANKIIPMDKIFKHKNSYAAFADWFRWKLMYLNGGYYVDTDVVCIKPFDFKEKFMIGWEEEERLLTPTVLKVEKGHPLALELSDAAEHPLRLKSYDDRSMILKKIRKSFYLFNRPKALGWGETAGPKGITRAYKYYKDKYMIEPVPRERFYYVKPEDWRDLLASKKISLDKLPNSVHGIHLWNNFWMKENIMKDGPFSKDSFIDQCFNKYYYNGK